MRDRLSLFPLETPLRLSKIASSINDQAARDIIDKFDLQMGRAWFGSGSFQHLPQGLSAFRDNNPGVMVTIHDNKNKMVEAYQEGMRVSLGEEEQEKYGSSHQRMVDLVGPNSNLDAVDPTIVAIGVKDGLVRVAAPVMDSQHQIAYWISRWPRIDEFSSLDAATLGITAKYTTFSLMQGNKFSTINDINLSRYISDFARGTLTQTQMGDLKDGLGLDLRRPYLVSAMDSLPGVSSPEATGIFNGTIDDTKIYVTNLRQNASKVQLAESLSTLTSNEGVAGVSDVRTSLVDTQKSTYEALVALGVGNALQRGGTVFFSRFRGL